MDVIYMIFSLRVVFNTLSLSLTDLEYSEDG